MRFDAEQVQQEMKRLETREAQHPGDPGEVSLELVMARLAGLPDELAEQVGMAALAEVDRAVNELLPYYQSKRAMTAADFIAIGLTQGMTFLKAIENVTAIEGTVASE